MFDLASIIMGSFQDDLTSVFGDSIGWLVGHAILLATLVAMVFDKRDSEPVNHHSG